MLILSASQILMLAGGPQRGTKLGELGILEDGAILVRDGIIAEVGPRQKLLSAYPDEPRMGLGDCVLMPGFVDPHTHVIWAGDRAAEFEMRLAGATYLEILQAGGGILSTVKATRAASPAELKAATEIRLWEMFRHGTTTIEAKTGYGLDTETEIKMLQVLLELAEDGPWNLAMTFLGAHAIAPEYKDDPEGYTQLVCEEMLPEVRAWWDQHAGGWELPFVDVFCETGAFDLDQSRRILEKAKNLGFPLKVHADEFDNLGGTSLAVELDAASADHLVATSAADIAALGRSGTAAVALPGTPFGLAEEEYTPAKAILEADGLLALATDLNPGTTWCESMQMAIALACRYMKLTPAQAIAAATINSAAAIGMQDKVGSLEVGKQADLVALKVDDYRHLGYRYGTNLVHTVIKKGEVFPIGKDD